MTADDYATLMDFLATRFARMDARFDAIEARLTRIEARQDAIEARLTRIEARQDAIEARQDAIEGRLARVEARQDAVETRLTRSEVLWESMRDDLRRVAEGVMAVSERLDRGLDGLQVRFDRFAVDFGTVQLDHGARIEALERHRRRRGPGG